MTARLAYCGETILTTFKPSIVVQLAWCNSSGATRVVQLVGCNSEKGVTPDSVRDVRCSRLSLWPDCAERTLAAAGPGCAVGLDREVPAVADPLNHVPPILGRPSTRRHRQVETRQALMYPS